MGNQATGGHAVRVTEYPEDSYFHQEEHGGCCCGLYRGSSSVTLKETTVPEVWRYLTTYIQYSLLDWWDRAGKVQRLDHFQPDPNEVFHVPVETLMRFRVYKLKDENDDEQENENAKVPGYEVPVELESTEPGKRPVILQVIYVVDEEYIEFIDVTQAIDSHGACGCGHLRSQYTFNLAADKSGGVLLHVQRVSDLFTPLVPYVFPLSVPFLVCMPCTCALFCGIRLGSDFSDAQMWHQSDTIAKNIRKGFAKRKESIHNEENRKAFVQMQASNPYLQNALKGSAGIDPTLLSMMMAAGIQIPQSAEVVEDTNAQKNDASRRGGKRAAASTRGGSTSAAASGSRKAQSTQPVQVRNPKRPWICNKCKTGNTAEAIACTKCDTARPIVKRVVGRRVEGKPAASPTAPIAGAVTPAQLAALPLAQSATAAPVTMATGSTTTAATTAGGIQQPHQLLAAPGLPVPSPSQPAALLQPQSQVAGASVAAGQAPSFTLPAGPMDSSQAAALQMLLAALSGQAPPAGVTLPENHPMNMLINGNGNGNAVRRNRSRREEKRSRSNSRSRSRSISRGRSRSRSASRSLSRDGSRSRSGERSRSDDFDKSRSYTPSRSRSLSRSRSRSISRSRSRSIDRSRSLSRNGDYSRSRSRDRDFSESRAPSRSRSRESYSR
jgi:hypothetical protein